MRIPTLVGAAGGALLAATVVAVPALAAGPSPQAQTRSVVASTAPAALTPAQQDTVEQFLAAHPRAATALASRAASWKAFATAHPELASELAKVAALPADQRRAALTAWLSAHPDQKAALVEHRKAQRADRRAYRKTMRDKAQQRRQHRRDAKSQRGAPSASPSASPTSTG